jgi:hypothetical protein
MGDILVKEGHLLVNFLVKLTDNSKLYLYNKIKHDIVLEAYLIKEKNFKNRQLIAKFRKILQVVQSLC